MPDTFKRIYEQLLNGVSALNAAGSCFLGGQTREHTVYIEWSAGVASGGVTVETASHKDYAGTWAPLQVVAFSAASKSDRFSFTGAFGAVRVRVSTVLAGGTVSSTIVAN